MRSSSVHANARWERSRQYALDERRQAADEHIRANYLNKPDPGHLLGDEFTLRELRIAHEAVADHGLQRDTFRRAMEPHLVATGATTIGTRGRPAELFRRLESSIERRKARG